MSESESESDSQFGARQPVQIDSDGEAQVDWQRIVRNLPVVVAQSELF